MTKVFSAPIANPYDAPEGRRREPELFRMWVGAYGTQVYVWADHFETAFEFMVEWCDDNAPGVLVDVSLDDYKEAAEDLGVPWEKHWPDYGDEDFVKVSEAAEADLTAIGHTTMKHGGFIPSWEWGGDEVEHGSPEWEAVYRRSIESQAE